MSIVILWKNMEKRDLRMTPYGILVERNSPYK